MSILTKVLIVLLSFSSLFLCGAVVTYVGTATNYKEEAARQKSLVATIQAENASLQRIAEEKDKLVERNEADYQDQIAQLKQANMTLDNDLKKAELASMAQEARADKWQAIVDSYSITIGSMDLNLQSTQAELNKIRQQSIKDKQELNQTYAKVFDTSVQMQRLEALRRKAEERAKLAEDQLAATGGQAVETTAMVVTQEKSTATPAIVASAGAVDLKGLISGVHEKMASISLGSADGVKKGMEFHVTRGDEFICDIVITDVDTNKSVGSLELVMQQPKVGDNVSTSM